MSSNLIIGLFLLQISGLISLMGKAATKSAALKILRRLRADGFNALFAGGCVRDMLLGHPSHDYDVATNASPYQVKKMFDHVLLVGAKFGVAMVVEQKRKVEVTTFRSDLDYADGRRPIGVKYSTPKKDAQRRDFTINGMFYDPVTKEVIDYVDGQKDLKRGVVRTIGNPHKRFDEDYLRMIRAVRFAVRFGFQLEKSTARAITRYAPNIASISGERICDELSKMFSIDSAGQSLELLEKLGLAKEILPELFTDSSWPDAVARVRYVSRNRDLILCMGALTANLDKDQIADMMRRWGASNDWKHACVWISHHLHDWKHVAGWRLSRFKKLVHNEHFERLRKLWRYQEYFETGSQSLSRKIAIRLNRIDSDQIHPVPFFCGADMKEMGCKPGPEMGKILRKTYDAQLDEEIGDKKQAMCFAEKLMEK